MDSAPDLAFVAPSLEELQPHFPTHAIEGFIAQGGMGAVYSARQVSLDRPVAIKILPRQFGADPNFRASFEAEAKAMARFNHPNLISVYDFGDADGMLYIIMELVEGKSLHHSAHGKAIEQKEAGRLVAGICHGLAHAHTHGILHRDIKPSNILLGQGAEPCIGDFGLARPLGQEHNPEEVIWGTPGYAAPEVVGDPNSVDQRADIFAVGVILYELLTARLPDDPWQPPSQIAKCSPEFDLIVQRATHPDPNQRYADAAQMGHQLDALVEKLQGPQISTLRTGAGPTAAVARPVAPSLVIPKSRSSAPVLIIVVIILALVGVLVVVLNQGKDDNEKDSSTKEEEASPNDDEGSTPEEEEDPKPERIVENPDPGPEEEDPDPPTPPQPEPPKELTPLERLAEAQDDLKAGRLEKLPPDAVEHRNSYYFLVPKGMDWISASQFAEDHGAQLAVLDSARDLSWAITQFQLENPIWLGLSDSGTEGKWFWTNGTPVLSPLWARNQPNNSPGSDDGEDFGALHPTFKRLDDLAGTSSLAFLLEWTKDHSNPGSLQHQLQRTAAALKQGKTPTFPAGTRNIGGSRFLLMPQKLSWDEASEIAVNAGGHLAVPSNEEEERWITQSLRQHLGGGDGCWMGGVIKGVTDQQWTFVTGERFEFVAWAPDEPDTAPEPQPVLQIRKSVEGEFGYHNTTRTDDKANYFLVEWSMPSRRNMPGKKDANRPADLGEWLVAQRKETIAREKFDYQRWKRRHDKIVKDFVNDIESEADTARRANRAIKDFVDNLTKEITKSGVVPESLGNSLAKRLLGDMHKKALSKQKKAWEDYSTDFEDAKRRYLEDIKEESTRRRAQGDRKSEEILGWEMTAAAEDDYFLQILAGEFPEVPEPEKDDDDN